MARRVNRNRRSRSVQTQATTHASTAPGKSEVRLALDRLPKPEREFYCNAVQLQRRINVVSFIFGQLGAGTTSIQNAVVVDVPHGSFRPLTLTFDEAFRSRLTEAMKAFTPIEATPDVMKDVRSVSYVSHVATLLVNEFASVLDFYELEPRLGGLPPVTPVIRVKSLPPVLKWFVDSCDQIANELSAQRIEGKEGSMTP
jgi:hypothetical protein